jgi:hypothetical protein
VVLLRSSCPQAIPVAGPGPSHASSSSGSVQYLGTVDLEKRAGMALGCPHSHPVAPARPNSHLLIQDSQDSHLSSCLPCRSIQITPRPPLLLPFPETFSLLRTLPSFILNSYITYLETSIRLSPTSTLKIAVSACDKVAKHSRIIILTLNTGVEILYYQTSDHSALVC